MRVNLNLAVIRGLLLSLVAVLIACGSTASDQPHLRDTDLKAMQDTLQQRQTQSDLQPGEHCVYSAMIHLLQAQDTLIFELDTLPPGADTAQAFQNAEPVLLDAVQRLSRDLHRAVIAAKTGVIDCTTIDPAAFSKAGGLGGAIQPLVVGLVHFIGDTLITTGGNAALVLVLKMARPITTILVDMLTRWRAMDAEGSRADSQRLVTTINAVLSAQN